MSLDADVIVDRRKLRRKLTLWRVVAFVAIAATLIIAAGWLSRVDPFDSKSSDHIARLSITGLITDNREKLRLIDKVAKAKAVKGVIVSINSPGGSTAGGEALYEALRKLAKAKPVVAHISTLGASAGYMAALASDHIVARRNALTGSIGVLFQFAEASGLLETIGVSVEEIKSSPLKAEPNFFKPPPDAAREVIRTLVLDTYSWFVGLVEERRKLDRTTALHLADGRVYSGQQAKNVKLIDAIGGEDVAISWLEESRKVAKELKVHDWTVVRDGYRSGFWKSAAIWAANQIGAGFLVPHAGLSAAVSNRLELDGLLSVWQVSVD